MRPDGDKVVVSGFVGGTDFRPQGPATIDMIVQEPVTMDSADRNRVTLPDPGGPTGC